MILQNIPSILQLGSLRSVAGGSLGSPGLWTTTEMHGVALAPWLKGRSLKSARPGSRRIDLSHEQVETIVLTGIDSTHHDSISVYIYMLERPFCTI